MLYINYQLSNSTLVSVVNLIKAIIIFIKCHRNNTNFLCRKLIKTKDVQIEKCWTYLNCGRAAHPLRNCTRLMVLHANSPAINRKPTNKHADRLW